jgi:hypothetical protein
MLSDRKAEASAATIESAQTAQTGQITTTRIGVRRHWRMSALVRIPESSRTSSKVRKVVPITDVTDGNCPTKKLFLHG